MFADAVRHHCGKWNYGYLGSNHWFTRHEKEVCVISSFSLYFCEFISNNNNNQHHPSSSLSSLDYMGKKPLEGEKWTNNLSSRWLYVLCARFTREPARWRLEPWFSYDVTAAKVVILSSETAAMLVSKTNLWNSILGKQKCFALVQNFSRQLLIYQEKCFVWFICAVCPLNKLRWFLESAWSQDIPCIVLTVSYMLDLWLTVKLLQPEDSKADLRYSLWLGADARSVSFQILLRWKFDLDQLDSLLIWWFCFVDLATLLWQVTRKENL